VATTGHLARHGRVLLQAPVDRNIDDRVVSDGRADVIISRGDEAVAVGLADDVVIHHLGSGPTPPPLRLRPAAMATSFGVPPPITSTTRTFPWRSRLQPARHAPGQLGGSWAPGPPPLAMSPRYVTPGMVAAAADLLGNCTVEADTDALGLTSGYLRRLLVQPSELRPRTANA
jgi:hypothetical protein